MPHAERCERCGGALFAMWRKPGTHLVLPLCRTHDNEHRPALQLAKWTCARVRATA